MLEMLLGAIFGIPDRVSWVDLDEGMRRRLRFWGVISVFVLIVLVMSSLYFYLRWPPVRILVDPLWKNVRASVVEKGDIPGWVVNVGSLWAGGTFVLSLFFFYFLVDLGKIHYKIDRVSLSIIPEVNRLIQSSMLNRLACPVRDGCALRRYVQTRSGERQFREVVFYYFANQDTVGSYNQRDKRRQVFGFWTQYYVFNYVMVIVLLCWLWICFLALLKAPTWITCALAATSILILVFWWWRGREYRRGAFELATDQVDAFCTHANENVAAQAATLVAYCGHPGCKIRPSSIAAP